MPDAAFTGTNCETAAQCNANPCQNGRTWADSSDVSSVLTFFQMDPWALVPEKEVEFSEAPTEKQKERQGSQKEGVLLENLVRHPLFPPKL